jgi:hypothetical protein
MRVRFYFDPETNEPHIYNHRISENEVRQILNNPQEDILARDGARMVIGQTAAGRYLRVIYVLDQEPENVFVITAYELKGKPLKAFRSRQRRR